MTAAASEATIRQLGPDDLAIFKAIRIESLQQEPEAFAGTIGDWQALDDAEWTRRMTDNPVFVGFRHSQPVGIVGLLREAGEKKKHRALVIMVYITATERGSGLAQALLDRSIEFARELGILQLELGVNAANPRAVRFYERNGFERVGMIPNFTLLDGVRSDEIVMVRRIG